MKNEKKYTQVNNPTQINIGTTENSLQTAGRKVKEIYNNPQDILNTTVDILDESIEGFKRGFILWFKTIIIPLMVCTFIAVWSFATYYRHESVWTFIIGTLWMFGQVVIMFSQVIFNEKMIPVVIVVGCGLLFIVWTTMCLMYRVFKNDVKRANKAIKLSLLTYLFAIVYKNG